MKITVENIKNLASNRKALSIALLINCMLMMFFSILGSSASSTSSAKFVANRFLNVGIKGGSINGEFIDSAGDAVLATSIISNKFNNGKYNIQMQVNQPRLLDGEPVKLGNAIQYTYPNGTKVAFQWYEQNYQFEFLVYTKATATDFMTLKSTLVPEKQWFKMYYSNGLGDDNWQNYEKRGWVLKEATAKCSFGGYTYSGNFKDESGAYKTTFMAKLGIIIGDDVTFPGELTMGTDGKYTLSGTLYYIAYPQVVASSAKTDYLAKVSPPSDIQIDTGAAASTDAKTPSTTPGSLPTLTQIPNQESGLTSTLISAKSSLATTNIQTEFAEFYFQTLPASDYSTTMTTMDDVAIKKNYSPDPSVLPAPNTECYITIPVDLKPKFSWNTCQFGYTSTTLWVRDPQDGFINKKTYIRNTVSQPIVDPTVFVTKKMVDNVYYLQSFKVPVRFASVYKWIPNPQYTAPDPPIIPPTETRVEPTYPTTTAGVQNVSVITPADPPLIEVPDWLKFVANPQKLWTVLGIIGAIIVVLVVLLASTYLRMSNPMYLAQKMAKMQMVNPKQMSIPGINPLMMPIVQAAAQPGMIYQQQMPQGVQQQMPQGVQQQGSQQLIPNQGVNQPPQNTSMGTEMVGSDANVWCVAVEGRSRNALLALTIAIIPIVIVCVLFIIRYAI